ncbi:MAG: hypothetical protein JSS98_19265 [Bacteroidetes bacterium]|nr:hypothetical protein [Bacteroidota bacterium]
MTKKTAICLSLAVIFCTSLLAQKNKPVPAAKQIAPSKEDFNTLSFTLIDDKGISKEIAITAASEKVLNPGSYFNAARVDKIHTDGNGEKEPVLKVNIQNEKNQSISVALYAPIINTPGTATATKETNYDNSIGWYANLEGYRLSPQSILISITKWASVGDFIEGTFTGTAFLIKENMVYDNDNPAPVCNIQNGKFKIKRVKDQSGYGGE